MSRRVKSLEHIDPTILTGEPLVGLCELASAIGAEGIARDTRRFDERTRPNAFRPGTLVDVEAFRHHVFEQLCVRLHHHIERMRLALTWTEDEQASQIHSLTICRLLCESVLDRCGDAFAAASVRLGQWLTIERTKFLMGTTADARQELAFELSSMQTTRRMSLAAATKIGERCVDKFRRRIRPEVGASITTAARATLRELFAAFGDLARAVPDLMFALLDIEAMSLQPVVATPPGPSVGLVHRIGLASRPRIVREAHEVLVAMLEDGSRHAIDAALERFDDARAELEHRACELIDDALAATKACISFAHAAHQAGPSRPEEVGTHLRSWAARLDRMIGRLPHRG